MSQDEKHPIAKNKVPSKVNKLLDAPLTKEQFATQMEKLAERARAAGFNPLYVMAQSYARQGKTVIEGLLTSLENAGEPKKKKKKT